MIWTTTAHRVKKSWFMFNDEMVCLAAGIRVQLLRRYALP